MACRIKNALGFNSLQDERVAIVLNNRIHVCKSVSQRVRSRVGTVNNWLMTTPAAAIMATAEAAAADLGVVEDISTSCYRQVGSSL